MASRKPWTSKATRRRDALNRIQQAGFIAAAAGGIGTTMLAPTPVIAVAAFLTAACTAAMSFRGSLSGTFFVTVASLGVYRTALELTLRDTTSDALMVAVALLVSGAAGLAAGAGALRADDRLLVRSSSPNCVSYDVLTLILEKELGRARRYGSSGTVAMLRLRNLDALTRPDAYHQHEILMSQILAMLAGNVRNSDTVCYLGDLHFAIVFPYASTEQAKSALHRLRATLAPLVHKRCPGLCSGPLDWHTVLLEYPADGEKAADLLDGAATAMGAPAQQRLAALEKERALKQAHLERLGYV